MKITIKDKEIELKYSIRAMLMYENMADKTLNPQGLTDVVTFMYCVLVASAKDYSITFDDFIDYLDENPDSLNEFGEWLKSTNLNNENFKKN